MNLAFLGANACYRQIRFEPSPVGPDRRQICYKDAAEDPMANVDPVLTTVNWPDPPVNRPESELIGSTYQDIQAQAGMVITDPGSWLFDGVGLSANQVLPDVVQGEFDRYVPDSRAPTNLDVVAHSIVPNRGNNYSDVTWYTVPGGGGVFATGNASWVGPGQQQADPAQRAPLGRARGDRQAAADHGEPVLGDRPRAGQPDPALAGQLAHGLCPGIAVECRPQYRRRRLRSHPDKSAPTPIGALYAAARDAIAASGPAMVWALPGLSRHKTRRTFRRWACLRPPSTGDQVHSLRVMG